MAKYIRQILIVGLLGVMPLLALADVDLPTIGQPSDTALSPAEEAEIGADIVSQLRSFNFFLDDAEITYYLRDVGNRLATYSGHNASEFDFYVVRDRQINAFALPGGYIGMNAGLILASESEDEMAGVLAHEIAHVTQRHIARQVEASSRFNLTTAAALLVAILAGASNPDVLQAALTIGLSTSAQQSINFTRAHEMEADRVGIRTLAASGYDPKGMAGFFQKMEERSRLYGNGLPEILRSHPVSNTRISEALDRISQYENLPAPRPEQDRQYRIMRARLRVITAAEAGDVLAYFSADTPGAGESLEDVRQYGLALAMFRAGRFDDSLDILNQLTEQHPKVVYYASALADSLLAAGRAPAALGVYKRSLKNFPNFTPLTLSYAEALIQAGQPAQARSRILGSDLLQRREPEANRLLALAARDMKRDGEAHYQMGQYHRSLREYRQALNQLEAGLRVENLSTADKAKLTTALARLREEVPEDFLRKYDRGERVERN